MTAREIVGIATELFRFGFTDEYIASVILAFIAIMPTYQPGVAQ